MPVRVATSTLHRACTALLAVLLVSVQSLSAAWADAPPAVKPTAKTAGKTIKHKTKRKIVHKSALYAVRVPALKGLGDAIVEPAPAVIARLTEQFVPRTAMTWDPELALRQANEEHPVQFTLQDNLHLEWQLKNYPTAERYPDVGMKVGLRYRF